MRRAPRESRKLGGLVEQDLLNAESSSSEMSLAMITTPSLIGVSSLMRRGSLNTPPTPFLSFRLWQPTGPTSTRIWSWLFVDKEASKEFRRATYEAYVRTFGPSGIFEQDDMENWEECTRVNSGVIAQRHTLHHGMGLHIPPDPNFPGPGTAWPGSYGERTQLCFYAEWKRWMTLEKPWVRTEA